MFSELAQGIGGAVIVLVILFLVSWAIGNHKSNAEHKEAMDNHDRQMREEFPTVFADKPTEQP